MFVSVILRRIWHFNDLQNIKKLHIYLEKKMEKIKTAARPARFAADRKCLSLFPVLNTA